MIENCMVEKAIEHLEKRQWSVIPVNCKIAFVSWTLYQKQLPTVCDVRSWWAAHPTANIGIVLGKVSGNLVAIDVDDADLAQRLITSGVCELTTVVKTPRGIHVYLRETDAVSSTSIQTTLGPNVDLKANGSYVVAPPSPGYSFLSEKPVLVVHDATEKAKELLAQVGASLPVGNGELAGRKPGTNHIRIGERDVRLTSICGTLHNRGKSTEDTLKDLRLINTKMTEEPLDDCQISKIVASINNRSNEGGLNPNHIVLLISLKYPMFFLNKEYFLYRAGVYAKVGQQKIHALIKSEVGDKFSANLVRDVEQSLKADVHITAELINQSDTLLNLKNGLMDLRTLQLAPHDEKTLSTVQLPIIYDPAAACPTWKAFLDEILGDEPSKITVLQEYCGYLLSAKTNQEKALLMLGEGANGKSTTQNVITGVLGESNVAAVSLERFKNPYYVASMFGKMANISSESEIRTKDYEATFKLLVTGDLIEVDQKYEHPFSFRNKAKLIFSFNALPPSNDTTDAFFRRLLIIPFNKQIPEERQNKELSHKLLQEKSGIFNWMVKGWQRLQEQGRFNDAVFLHEAIKDYRKANNSVLSFVEDACELAVGHRIRKGNLYEAYKKFCFNGGSCPFPIISFGKELKARFSVADASGAGNTKLWLGIKLRDEVPG